MHTGRDFEVGHDWSVVSGWSGNTVFYRNGNVGDKGFQDYIYRGPPNPKVLITQNMFGFYKMVVLDDDRGVGVSQDKSAPEDSGLFFIAHLDRN